MAWNNEQLGFHRWSAQHNSAINLHTRWHAPLGVTFEAPGAGTVKPVTRGHISGFLTCIFCEPKYTLH